jgi:hypothetical protein
MSPMINLTIPMPRIASVEAVRDLVIRVKWNAGIRANRNDIVDLSPLIKALKFYRPLHSNPSLFRSVHLIEGGTILAWGDDDEIDMAADSVEQLAEESMSSDDFRDFLRTNQLTHSEAAALLGYSRRHIENFLSGKEPIPRVVVMACFGLLARKNSRRGQFAGAQLHAQAQVQTIDNLSSGLTGTISTPARFIMRGQTTFQSPTTAKSLEVSGATS